MQEITFEDLYLNDTTGELKYNKEDLRNLKTIKLGQRKLFLALCQILFLAQEKFGTTDFDVLYIGAAPGDNIFEIAKIIKGPRFHLFDPLPFAFELVPEKREKELQSEWSNRNIATYSQFFTDEDAEKWNKKERTVFISDIRSKILTSEIETPEVEQIIWNDMLLQQRIVEILQPKIYSLKFRLPWPEIWSPTGNNFVEYLDGRQFWGIWNSKESSEIRLVGESPIKRIKYNLEKHQKEIFWHNRVQRREINYKFPKFLGSDTFWDSAAEYLTWDKFTSAFKIPKSTKKPSLGKNLIDQRNLINTPLIKLYLPKVRNPKFDERTLSLASSNKEAKRIVEHMKRFKFDKIVDLTTGIGGILHQIQLSYKTCKIEGYEIDKKTFEMAKHNLKTRRKDFKLYNKSGHEADVTNAAVIMDPLWIEISENKYQKMGMIYGEEKIENVIKRMMKTAKVFFVKTPPDYELNLYVLKDYFVEKYDFGKTTLHIVQKVSNEFRKLDRACPVINQTKNSFYNCFAVSKNELAIPLQNIYLDNFFYLECQKILFGKDWGYKLIYFDLILVHKKAKEYNPQELYSWTRDYELVETGVGRPHILINMKSEIFKQSLPFTSDHLYAIGYCLGKRKVSKMDFIEFGDVRCDVICPYMADLKPEAVERDFSEDYTEKVEYMPEIEKRLIFLQSKFKREMSVNFFKIIKALVFLTRSLTISSLGSVSF